jgi:hypothetical protein
MARPGRFELPTSCFGGKRSIQLSYGRTETSGIQFIVSVMGSLVGAGWVIGNFLRGHLCDKSRENEKQIPHPAYDAGIRDDNCKVVEIEVGRGDSDGF